MLGKLPIRRPDRNWSSLTWDRFQISQSASSSSRRDQNGFFLLFSRVLSLTGAGYEPAAPDFKSGGLNYYATRAPLIEVCMKITKLVHFLDNNQGNYNINNDNSLDNSNVFETNTNSYGNNNYDQYGSGSGYNYGSNSYDNTNSGYGTGQGYGQDNANPNSWDNNDNMDLDNLPTDDPCAVSRIQY